MRRDSTAQVVALPVAARGARRAARGGRARAASRRCSSLARTARRPRGSRTLGPRTPSASSSSRSLAGYALLVTAMVFLGFSLIELLCCRSAGSRSADEDFSRGSPTSAPRVRTDLSWVGSTLAGGLVIPAVIGVCLVVFLVMRRWLLAAFVAVRGRRRVRDVSRDVARSSSASVPTSTASRASRSTRAIPSGHTAATVALYGGLLLLLASRFDNVAGSRCSPSSSASASALRRLGTDVPRHAPPHATSSRACSWGSLALGDHRVRRPRGDGGRERARRGDEARRREERRRHRPRGQVDGRRARGAAPGARARRGRGSALVRGAEEQVRARARREGARRRRRARSSSGAATAWCSAAST